MEDIISALQKNEGHTYFGGKDGYDFVCFNKNGVIMCSGTKESMLERADKNGYAVAILIPVTFTDSVLFKDQMVPKQRLKMIQDMILQYLPDLNQDQLDYLTEIALYHAPVEKVIELVRSLHD